MFFQYHVNPKSNIGQLSHKHHNLELLDEYKLFQEEHEKVINKDSD